MIFRLAYNNIKKSKTDYVVYFVTMIVGVALFYAFYSIINQRVVEQVLLGMQHSFVRILKSVLQAAGFFVSFVLAFLLMYANKFLMKRRKKEFGIYSTLGMEKKTMAGILLTETVIVGVLSFGIGLLCGIVLSQGISMLITTMFEADMSRFAFAVSGSAVGKTALYFGVVYVLVLVLNLRMIGKSDAVFLIKAERMREKNVEENPIVSAVVFVVAAAILGHAYYMLTVKVGTLVNLEQICLQMMKIIVSTFLIFKSLSGLLLFLAGARKNFYMKGLHSFTVKQISSRVNTNVMAGSFITLLMFLGIAILSSCISASTALNSNLKKLVPVDVSFMLWGSDEQETSFDTKIKSVSDLFREAGVDTGMFRDVEEITVYNYYEWDEENQEMYTDGENIFANCGDLIRLSDYNRMAAVYGLEHHELAEDEYMVVANYGFTVKSYNQNQLAEGHVITLGGKSYHPKYKVCQDGFLDMSCNQENLGFTVVPDSAVDQNLHPVQSYYFANYNAESKSDLKKLDAYITGDEFYGKVCPGKTQETGELVINAKSRIYEESIGLASMAVFLGMYLGIIFFVAGAVVFSLKELSQTVDSSAEYRILSNLGVDRKMMHRSLFGQQAIFFGMPLALAVLYAVIGVKEMQKLILVYIMEIFGKTAVMKSIAVTTLALLAVYLIYFAVTYRCSRNIIEEGKG